MGTVSTGTFTADDETVTRSKLNDLVTNLLTEFNGNVDNDNIASNAGILASKLDLTAPGAIGSGTANTGAFTTATLSTKLEFSDETVDIGTSSVGLNDLHFGSGGIINWDGGDITLTHSAAKLTFGGDGSVEIDFNNHEMTNVDINSGTMNGVTIAGCTLGGTLDCNDQQMDDMRLENRTNDTGMTATGQIWFRTDL